VSAARQPPGPAVYRLHGVRIALACSDAEVRRVVEDGLVYKGAQAAGAGAADLHLTFHSAADLPELPTGLRRLGGHGESGIDVWYGDDGYWLAGGDEVRARIDVEGGAAEAWLRAGPGASAGRRRTALPFYVLTMSLVLLLTRVGRYVLHAAALVGPRGGSVLICAPSGAGKSTMTLNLLRAGWRLVTDDSVLLSVEGDGVQAGTFRRDLNLSPDAADLLPVLTAREWPPPPGLRDKWRVAPEDLFPDCFLPRTTPTALVFPQRTESGPSQIRPLPTTEAFARLVSQSALGLVQGKRGRSGYVEGIRRLALQCSAWGVEAGPDLRDDPGLVSGLLKDALTQSAPAS
jgi:hypothetical protein